LLAELKYNTQAPRISEIKSFVRRATGICVYLLIFLEIYHYATSTTGQNYTVWAIITAQSIRLMVDGKTDTLTVSLGIIYFTLFAFPSAGLIVFQDLYPRWSLIAFIVCFDAIRLFQGNQQTKTAYYTKRLSRNAVALFFLLQIWMLTGPFAIRGGSLITLVAPLSISVVILELMLKSNSSNKLIFFAVSSLGLVLISHITFHWSGFGRLVIGSYVIFIALVVMKYRNIKFRLWLVPFLLPIALYFAQLSRYGNVTDIGRLVGGSAGHHLIVTNDIFTLADQGYSRGIGEFLDQFKLFFLGWFPRSFWPDKPLGAGLTSVDVVYGRQGVSLTYSQSLGFLGEQVYLLGNYGIVGLALIIGIIIVLRSIIARVSGGFIAPLAAFDVSLMSFFWGSMSTFGNRVWFLLIPGLAFLIMRNLKFKK